MNCIKQLWKDEKGLGMIELAIIIVIVIGLALIFQEQIEDLIQTIFEKINLSIKGM